MYTCIPAEVGAGRAAGTRTDRAQGTEVARRLVLHVLAGRASRAVFQDCVLYDKGFPYKVRDFLL